MGGMAKIGRPTDYTPEMGDKILELMDKGFSLAASASQINIHRQRVYEWMERHPEFADTIRLAQVKRQYFLENRLLTADASPIVTSTIFALKNAGPEDWRDKREVEHSGEMGVRKLEQLSDEELAKLAAGG